MTPEQAIMLQETHAGVKVLQREFENQKEDIGELKTTVYGNGRSGLKVDVAIMKKWFASLWLITGAIGMSVIGIIGTAIVDYFTNH